MLIYHYLTLFPSTLSTLENMNNTQLLNMCFSGISEEKWGYGDKRIGVKMAGSITNKIPFSGFGYKDKAGNKYIAMRMWLDQGDYVEMIPYSSQFTVNQHFMNLISVFEQKYQHLC